jgi:N-acetylmuramoyl-L-alanine amidase
MNAMGWNRIVAGVVMCATAGVGAAASGGGGGGRGGGDGRDGRGGDPRARAPDRDDCGLESPAVALAVGSPAPRPEEVALVARRGGGEGSPVVARLARRIGRGGDGALAGKTVYLSAGHGFTWEGGGWHTQRGTTHGIVEDLVSAEAINQFLVDELERMGARVVTVREHDLNPAQVVVDDGDASLEGGAVELGAGPVGYGAVATPVSGQTNPFRAGGTRQLQATKAGDRARAVYAPLLAAAGAYDVYVSWAAGVDRAADARVTVRHAGGETHFSVDQRRHGGTWVRLGRFWFEAGRDPARGSVVVADQSATPGVVISLDAVRFGGGTGLIDRGGGPSPRPTWELAARYSAQLFGAPASVYDYTADDGSDDVGARARFAAWDHESGEDAIYLAWHTNAPSPGRGTESYVYGPSPPPAPLGEFSGVAGSLELQAAVHGELVADLRAAWDPSWIDRGKFTAYFGEVNPNHNPEMPAVLVEIGFHATAAEADAIRDPRFRRIACRALAQGVARYFAERDGAPLLLPPAAPDAIVVANDGAGGLTVSWRAPAPVPGGGDPATGYRVYLSRDGRSFDDGTDVSGGATSLALASTGLGVGAMRWVRVAAWNQGGESPPSPLVGARVGARPSPLLVVGGFDRLDASQLIAEDLGAELGVVDRLLVARMNDGAYALRHGRAAADYGIGFDGASDHAVGTGMIELGDYRAVDWFVGLDSVVDRPLDDAGRDALARYLAGGGRLLFSGAEIGYALGLLGDGAEQAFLRDVLRVVYVADGSQSRAVRGRAAPYLELPTAAFGLSDDVHGYVVAAPDVLGAGVGADVALVYGDSGGAGGNGEGAAIAWGAAAPGARGLVLGFPFETIAGAEARAAVMAKSLAFLGVEPDPMLVPDAGVDGGGVDADGSGGGCGCDTAGARGAGGQGGVVTLALITLIFVLGAGKLRFR